MSYLVFHTVAFGEGDLACQGSAKIDSCFLDSSTNKQKQHLHGNFTRIALYLTGVAPSRHCPQTVIPPLQAQSRVSWSGAGGVRMQNYLPFCGLKGRLVVTMASWKILLASTHSLEPFPVCF